MLLYQQSLDIFSLNHLYDKEEVINPANSDLFAGLIWQIVAYLPDNIRHIVSYLPDNIRQIISYLLD